MKKLCLIAVTLTALGMTGVSYADPAEHAVKIRREYRGSEAPDHVMFGMHVGSMKGTAEFNRDIALDIVQQHMHFESREAADAFLSRLIIASEELRTEQDKVLDETVCQPDAPRSKEALYQLLDQMDDLYEVKDHNAYVKFLSSLDASQQDAMDAWLEEEKEGFYGRAADHQSMWEHSGQDVVEWAEVVCAMRASR